MSNNQGRSNGENYSNRSGYGNNNSGFAILVVLFILLIIVGAAITSKDDGYKGGY